MHDRTRSRPQQDGDRLVLSVPEAATRLGVTPDAIRARLHRGTLAGEKVGGAWRVFLPGAPTGEQQDADRPATDALVSALHDRIDSLERQLAERTEEIRRRDHLIAGFIERLPELPAGQDAAVSEMQVPTSGAVASKPPDTTPAAWRRWWRRMTGGG
jgi:excisionase family DNA binding protein